MIRVKETDMATFVRSLRADQHGVKVSVWEKNIQRVLNDGIWRCTWRIGVYVLDRKRVEFDEEKNMDMQ